MHRGEPVERLGPAVEPAAMSAAQQPEAELLTSTELLNCWLVLSTEERRQGFAQLSRPEAETLFLALRTEDQAEILVGLPKEEWRSWVRLLPPNDAADLIQVLEPEDRSTMLTLLDEPTRREVLGLLAYAEDQAGGLMDPRYARLRPEMSVAEAHSYLRRYASEHRRSTYYAYVLDAEQRLLGTISFRDLFAAESDEPVADIMHTKVVRVTEDQDQEEVGLLFATYRFLALPVVDAEGHMKGVVTVNDIVDVVQEEATEDIHKIGGTEALEGPYLRVNFLSMARKRGSWLAALFLGEMLTATAMGYFEQEIARAVVLALFVPLIISSGGNSGSQATTLVIRAMALGEVRLRDWWRVIRRELAAGVVLGGLLGTIGVLRIVLWHAAFDLYGAHFALIAVTVGLSLIGVVTFGTLVGSMLPFVLRLLGCDPASASAPFVATLVDVTGLIIYFTVASIVLSGTLL